MPSGEVRASGAITCSRRPATRTWKKSSRLSLTIARKRILSASGRATSSAIDSTRPSKSRRESSRLKNRSCGKARACAGARTVDLTATELLRPRQHGVGQKAHRQGDRRESKSEGEAADHVAGPVFAQVDAADANDEKHERGDRPETGDHRPRQTAHRQTDDEHDQEPAEEGDV